RSLHLSLRGAGTEAGIGVGDLDGLGQIRHCAHGGVGFHGFDTGDRVRLAQGGVLRGGERADHTVFGGGEHVEYGQWHLLDADVLRVLTAQPGDLVGPVSLSRSAVLVHEQVPRGTFVVLEDQRPFHRAVIGRADLGGHGGPGGRGQPPPVGVGDFHEDLGVRVPVVLGDPVGGTAVLVDRGVDDVVPAVDHHSAVAEVGGEIRGEPVV